MTYKINEYFSNFKWEDIFQNRNTNECWMKFLEIEKEALELYVPTRGQRKRKVPPWMTNKVLPIRKYKSVLWKKYRLISDELEMSEILKLFLFSFY